MCPRTHDQGSQHLELLMIDPPHVMFPGFCKTEVSMCILDHICEVGPGFYTHTTWYHSDFLHPQTFEVVFNVTFNVLYIFFWFPFDCKVVIFYFPAIAGHGQRRSNAVKCTYTLMNIPRTKSHQHNNRKCCATKTRIGLGEFHDAETVSPVSSNITCLCDFQTALTWMLRARWLAVINLDLIDISMVENSPQPEWAKYARSFWCPEIIIEAMECKRLAINLIIRITCWCIWHH